MKVSVFFEEMDKYNMHAQACVSPIGWVELDSLDFLSVPYKVWKNNENLYCYLTEIGKAKIESIYPAPEFVTSYIVLMHEQPPFKSDPNGVFERYNKMMNEIRKTFGCDEETLKKQQELRCNTSHTSKTKTIQEIIRDGMF